MKMKMKIMRSKVRRYAQEEKTLHKQKEITYVGMCSANGNKSGALSHIQSAAAIVHSPTAASNAR